jgi:uncharacterized membrane protein YhiD involved in acid resistance
MPRIAWSIALVIMVIVVTISAQTVPAPSPQSSEASSDQLQAMQEDAKKMRVILDQMRTNLAFVQTSQTPLKHQFELEIDMWQVLLEQMDRRIDKMQSSAKPSR